MVLCRSEHSEPRCKPQNLGKKGLFWRFSSFFDFVFAAEGECREEADMMVIRFDCAGAATTLIWRRKHFVLQC